jgi:hypothetical protein
MSLRIRRGTDAQRQGIVFDLGEILYTTDTQKLYVGDGITAGAKNILATSAGSGLVWNADDQVLEFNTQNLGINTSEISEGSNKYFTTVRAQDAAASLFTSGTHSNISFAYDDVHGKINATVTLDGVGILTVQSDVSPALGGNLSLNSHSVTGTGNINITGSITATGNITTSTGSLLVKHDAQNIVDFRGINANGSNATTPQLNLYSSRGTTASPVNSNAGDYVGILNFGGYNNGYQTTASIISLYDSSANMNDPFPASDIAFITNSGSGNNIAYFDKNGIFNAPTVSAGDGSAAHPSITFTTDGSVDTGFFHPGDGIIAVSINGVEKMRFDSGGIRVGGFVKVAQVSGTLPSPPEAGMIVLDGTTFKGYNGSTWVNLN